MIRTLIEVSGDDHHEHKRDLTSALATLGFEPKESHEDILFRSDLFDVIQELLGKAPGDYPEVDKRGRS